MLCKFCGKSLAENSSFCKYCGKKLDNSAPADNSDCGAVQKTPLKVKPVAVHTSMATVPAKDAAEKPAENQKQTYKNWRTAEMARLLEETETVEKNAKGHVLLLMWVQLLLNIFVALSVFLKMCMIGGLLTHKEYSLISLRDAAQNIGSLLNDINVLDLESVENTANMLQIGSFFVIVAVVIGFLLLIVAGVELFVKKNHESFIKESANSLIAFLLPYIAAFYALVKMSEGILKGFVVVYDLAIIAIVAAGLGIAISYYTRKRLG